MIDPASAMPSKEDADIDLCEGDGYCLEEPTCNPSFGVSLALCRARICEITPCTNSPALSSFFSNARPVAGLLSISSEALIIALSLSVAPEMRLLTALRIPLTVSCQLLDLDETPDLSAR